jgi:PAS domain S-box-containing protein
MERVSDVLTWAVAAGFVALAIVSIRQWFKTRERVAGYLALAMSFFGTVVLVSRVNDFTTVNDRLLSDLSLFLFLGSGYFLMLFRHGFIPLPRTVRNGVLVAMVVAAAANLIVRPPIGPTPEYSLIELLAVVSVIGLWGLCVCEASVRFWTAARGKPVVQRARLRALSGACACLVVLVVLVVFGGVSERPTLNVAVNGVALALVPVLYASFAPPRWLRASWRAREEESMRLAEELAEFSPTVSTIAEIAVDRVMRLVGAEAAFIRDASGALLAHVNISSEQVDGLQGDMNVRLPFGDRSDRHVILSPLKSEGESGCLGVVLGPFAPLFGSDEMTRVRDYAALVGVALDRVTLVEALQEESGRYEALLRAVSDVGEGCVVTAAGRCVYANEAYQKMSGYSLDELTALPSLLELSIPEERPALVQRLKERLSGEDVSEHYEAGLLCKDGSVKSVEVAVKLIRMGKELRIISIVRDVTARKQTQRSLERQAQTLQLLNEIAVSANEAVEVEGALRSAVEAVCNYTGWPVGHVLLSPHHASEQLNSTGIWYLADERFAPLREATEKTDMTRLESLPGTVVTSGEPAWTDSLADDPRGSALPDDLRALHGFAFPILTGSDTTGVVEFFSESAIEPSEEFLGVMANVGAQVGRAVERHRIETFRNEFISNAAHELRTPVTPIVGYSTLLAERWKTLSDADREAMTKTLRQQGNRLRILVNNLLDFTRVQRGRLLVQLGEVHLGEVFESALRAVPPPEGKSVELAGGADLTAIADRTCLEDVFVNLLVNAYRYGGRNIVVEGSRENGSVLAAVADDGPGVKPDLVPELFDPFTRGEGSAGIGGSGLGLAIVRTMMEAQGGDVWYEPNVGRGARFVVRLRPPSKT